MIHKFILTGAAVITLAMCSTKSTDQNSDTVTTATEKSGADVTDSADSNLTSKTESPIKQRDVSDSKETTKSRETITTKSPTKNSPIANQNAAAKSSSSSAKSGNSGRRAAIFLNEGENRFLSEYEMNITFKKITEDSRCPTGVNCIWQGTATAEIELMGTYTRPRTVSLSTVDMPGKGYSQSTVFNGYRITLVSVEPYPQGSKSAKKVSGSYKIGVTIMKDGSNTIDPTARSGSATK